MAFPQDYKKISQIGAGAFGKVYKVKHAELGYVRALKICNNFIEDKNDKAWLTFLNECKVLLNIGNGSHPNIVRIYQPRLIGNQALVEMDCVDGENLHQFMTREQFVPYDEFRRFAEQVMSAVAYCHVDIYRFLMNPAEDGLELDPEDGRKYVVSKEKEEELINKYGVVHNDLHSGNVMRREYDGQYILLDFGLAIQNNKCVKSSSRHDGAIEYSSPEKLSRGAVTKQSDVYSLGILLYEMLSGEVPFQSRNLNIAPEAARSQVFRQHLNEQPSSIFEKRKKRFELKYPGKEYKRDYPEWLDEFIYKCLEKNPEKRFRNAKEMLLEFQKHSEEVAETVSPAPMDDEIPVVLQKPVSVLPPPFKGDRKDKNSRRPRDPQPKFDTDVTVIHPDVENRHVEPADGSAKPPMIFPDIENMTAPPVEVGLENPGVSMNPQELDMEYVDSYSEINRKSNKTIRLWVFIIAGVIFLQILAGILLALGEL